MDLHTCRDVCRHIGVIDRAQIAIRPITKSDGPRFIEADNQRALAVGEKRNRIIFTGAVALKIMIMEINTGGCSRFHMSAAAAANFFSQPSFAIFWRRKSNLGMRNIERIKQRKKLPRIFNTFDHIGGIAIQLAALRQRAQQIRVVLKSRSVHNPGIGIARRYIRCGLQQGMPGEARQTLLVARYLLRNGRNAASVEIVE